MLNTTLHTQHGDGECGLLCKHVLRIDVGFKLTPGSILTGIAFVGIALTYFPKRTRPIGTTKREVAKKIDYIGAFLSIVGLTLLYNPFVLSSSPN